MCNRICIRFKAKRIGRYSMYGSLNVRCCHCDRFINRDGIYMGTSKWRCKCCNRLVRFVPYGGRKSINYVKVKDKKNVL